MVVRLAIGTLAFGLEGAIFLLADAFLVEETEAVVKNDRKSD
jgi:hypothetical protein